MKKFCIVAMDCVDSNAFRVAEPSAYMPKPKKTEEERLAELRAQLANGGWPRDEEEDVNPVDLNRIINRIGRRDEFRTGCMPIPDDIGKPFFTNPETQKLFAKYTPRILNKSDYEQIIETMRKRIVDNYYEALRNPNNWRGVLETKMEMWEAPHEYPYNLDFHSNSITNLHNIEIQIWDLIRMYKAVDWLRDTVMVYEW
jgi:hypothetical protein